MIKLKLVSGEDIHINEHFIESIEASSQADTNVRLHEGTTFVALDTPKEILDQMVDWQKRCAGN